MNKVIRRAARRMEKGGALLWKGKNNGQRVVALVKFGSKNRKTGDMVSLTYFLASVKPTDAIKDGRDAAVCDGCEHRPVNARQIDARRAAELGRKLRAEEKAPRCYVPYRALNAQWGAFKRGKYLPLSSPARVLAFAELLSGRMVRFGQYGNTTAALPFGVALAVAKAGRGWTGYDHNWRDAAPEWARLLMASVASAADKAEANARGWRTFRIIRDVSERLPDEIICPASPEATAMGKATVSCETCGFCNGTGNGRNPVRRNVAIIDHGPTGAASLENLSRLRQQLADKRTAGRVALPMV